ncbi:MAG: hypothetical protein AAGC56_13135, partial [Pseudomonadota bacterium]
MRLTIAALFALPVAAGTALASPTAEEITAYCEAYAAENGTDASGCGCLGEAAAEDATLAEAIMAIASPADFEAADDATKAAVGA